jgi:membrane-associated phospholipid phosphatase
MRHAQFSRPRALLFALLILVPVLRAPAQLSVSLVPDGLSAAEGGLLAVASLALPASTQDLPADADRVNGFDRLAMFGYSRLPDAASDVTQYAAAALPLALVLLVSQDQAFAGGFIYFEVLSRAFFAKNALKFLFPRPRPWQHFPPASGSAPAGLESNNSFPSGHSTFAFASAAFGITVAVLDLPSGSPWLLPFAATEAGLAVLTGSLRIFSGMHFMTDVLVGAALGTAIGIALPLMHTSWTGGSVGKSAPAARFEIPVFAFAL